MSTEQQNNTQNPKCPNAENDRSWEANMMAFVESTDNAVNTAKQPNKRVAFKWVSALQKRFRRRTVNLILTSAATLLLAVVMLVVMISWKDNPSIIAPEENTDASVTVTETPKITLINKVEKKPEVDTTNPTGSGSSSSQTATNSTYLTKIDIKNADDTFTIFYDEAKKTYALKGYDDIDLSTEMLLTLRHYTETIAATEKVKEISDLAVYGLEKPDATADIFYADGTSARLFVGDKTPSETGYYGQLEGDDSVYIFESDAVALFRFRSTAFVNTTLISSPTVKSDDTYGTAMLKEIRYSGTAHPTPLALRRSQYNDSEELAYFSYIIVDPYVRCTSDQVSTALGGMKSLSAEQALFIHPTEEQKEKMGFNNPLIKIEATMAVETDDESIDTGSEEVTAKRYYDMIDYTLIIGSINEDGDYIAMLDGVDAIFLISKSSYEYVLGLTYQNAVNEYLFFKHIKNLERISVSFDGQTHDFHLTHYPDKENQEDQMAVTIDGKIYPTEEFRKLYELIMALERHNAPAVEPTNAASLTLALYDTNGDLYLSAEYFETDATLCTVKTAEGEIFTTLWSDVSFFIKQVVNYLNGETVLIRN